MSLAKETYHLVQNGGQSEEILEILGVCMNFCDQFVQCVFRKLVDYLQVQFEPGVQGD